MNFDAENDESRKVGAFARDFAKLQPKVNFRFHFVFLPITKMSSFWFTPFAIIRKSIFL